MPLLKPKVEHDNEAKGSSFLMIFHDTSLLAVNEA